MAELDQIWMDLLDQASLRAIENGQHRVADYLRLKLANDTIRQAGVDWLFQTLIDQASAASKDQPQLRIDRVSPHSFKIGTSNMVGSLIQVQHGVRCVSLEAGWVRTPSDGIMRNSALAHARIKHFGMASEDNEFRLIRGEPLPLWIDEEGAEIRADDIHRHLQIVLSH
ncbi:hypothetical protein BH20ACI2_BH20ACI2_15840 [soil metagenome]